MILKEIEILNFKNIPSEKLHFSSGVNCLLGMNGMGKSNLLDAIHYLGVARSMSSVNDSALISHGEESMMIKGTYITDNDGEDVISCGLSKGRPKRIKRNGKEYRKLSEHIGRYPVVTSTPADVRLVEGAAEERRKLIDMVISQSDPVYLQSLIRYNKGLESRNKMLRAGVKDILLYESLETGMDEAAAYVWKVRKEWIDKISPEVEKIYSRLAGVPEVITISYKSKLNGATLKELFKERYAKDLVLGFTSAGIHRDDMEVMLGAYPIKNLGSQGQAKTFTVALKLAIYNYLADVKKTKPLLLLDDIFDKLDASRVENIMREVTGGGSFGQIFITDTNRKHLDDIMAVLPGESTMFNVEHGKFNIIDNQPNGTSES